MTITDFRLQVFVTTARELSFTRAAEELNISQPAVTKHIKELERLLSLPLFHRSGNRIKLTEYGERLLPLSIDVLRGYEKLSDQMASDSGEFAGRLRIGASSTIAQYILPEILARFRREYPNVEISMMSGNSEGVLAALESERVDISLIEDAHSSPTFHYETFAEDSIVLVSSRKRPQRISIDDVKGLSLVLRECGSGTLDVVERELARHNISRRSLSVEMQIGSSEGIVRYLKASRCYAFISRAAVSDYLSRGELYVADVEGLSIKRSLRCATIQGRSNRLVNIFIESCREGLS